MKRITIKDVAERSGYTVATVSRALNYNAMVNENTREKIFDIAKEMGYIDAEKTSSESITAIGVVVPDIHNPYFPLLIKGIQEQLSVEGLGTLICNANSNPQTETECIKALVDAKVKGIIMDPLTDHSYKKVRYLNDKMPVVFTSNVPEGANINYITIDNYAAAQIATNYLISLEHTQIAYIGGNEETDTYRSRFAGYCDTMKKHFSHINTNLICKAFPDRASGFRAANKIMTTNQRPTAFFASNDSLALGVLEYLQKHGFDVPKDISVIGIDNIEWSSLPGIDLTTIEEPRYLLGQTAATSMSELLNHRFEIEKRSPLQITLQPKLIIRNTCGKAHDYMR